MKAYCGCTKTSKRRYNHLVHTLVSELAIAIDRNTDNICKDLSGLSKGKRLNKIKVRILRILRKVMRNNYDSWKPTS